MALLLLALRLNDGCNVMFLRSRMTWARAASAPVRGRSWSYSSTAPAETKKAQLQCQCMIQFCCCRPSCCVAWLWLRVKGAPCLAVLPLAKVHCEPASGLSANAAKPHSMWHNKQGQPSWTTSGAAFRCGKSSYQHGRCRQSSNVLSNTDQAAAVCITVHHNAHTPTLNVCASPTAVTRVDFSEGFSFRSAPSGGGTGRRRATTGCST